MSTETNRETDVSDLVGRTVITSDGHTLGDVADVVVDLDRWSVVAIRIRLQANTVTDFELKKPWFGAVRITLPVSEIRGLSDTIVLRAAYDDVKRIASSET